MTAPDDFTIRLRELTADDIVGLAAAVRAKLSTAEGEVAWWQATIELEAALRRTRRTRQATIAAHRASLAVWSAARAAGVDESRSADVEVVARAAADAARARLLAAAPPSASVSLFARLAPWAQLAA